MKTWTKGELTIIAYNFIRDCNVLGLVSVKEGGHIELSSLLVDFVKYQKDYAVPE